MKQYHIQSNVGKCKYIVNYHDGISKHKDGSKFYAIAIFSSKKALNNFITKLSKMDYKEKPFSP